MIKKLATAVTLALMCSPVMANEQTGFYLGGGVGRVTLKDSIAGYRIRATDTGLKVFGGYRFNEFGSLEAAYLESTPNDSLYGVNIESDASAIQGSALWQVPISNRFEAFVRFSIIAWEAKNSATDGQSLVTQENDGTDLGLGIGAAFYPSPRLGLRAEYEGAEFDGTDFRSLSIEGLFRF